MNAAEKLFLEKGLEKAKMIDIAAKAGITKISLYRYFPHRDEIALEIHARMMNKITSLVPILRFPFVSLLAIAAYTGIKLHKLIGNIYLGGIVNGLLTAMITFANIRFTVRYSSVI